MKIDLICVWLTYVKLGDLNTFKGIILREIFSRLLIEIMFGVS